jgi:hypothetical protein
MLVTHMLGDATAKRYEIAIRERAYFSAAKVWIGAICIVDACYIVFTAAIIKKSVLFKSLLQNPMVIVVAVSR